MKLRVPFGLIITYLFVVAFWCMAFMGLMGRLRDTKASKKALSWPSTPGRVLESEVRKVGKYHSLDIVYEYTVDGRDHTSNVFSLAGLGPYRNYREAGEAFPAGKGVNVYYDPEDPANAVLLPGARSAIAGYIFALIVGGLILGVFTLVLFAAIVAGTA